MAEAQVQPEDNVEAQVKDAADDMAVPVPLGPMKQRIVDQLNPKLTNFSNPFMLAIPIIFLTLIGFICMAVAALNNCQTKSSGMILSNADGHTAFVKENVKCVEAIGFPTTKPATFTSPGGTTRNVHVSLEPCTPTGFFEAVGLSYCAGEPAKSYPNIDFSGTCPHQDSGDLYAAYYSMEFCPTGFEAIGTALAYTGYIEAFFTFIIVGVLLQVGVVRALNKDATLFGAVTAAAEFDAEKEQLDTDIEQMKADIAALKAKK